MSAARRLSRDEIAEVREIFDHFDTNRNGLIEASEFKKLVHTLDAEMDPDAILVGLSVVDADGNGTVEWEEFLGWWAETRTT